MKRGKWTALLLCGAMLLCQCAFALDLGEEEQQEPIAAAVNDPEMAVPPKGRNLFFDNFSEQTMKTNWVQEPAGVAQIQDGRLSLARTASGDPVSKLTGYFKADGSSLTGTVGISFDLYRNDKTKKIQIQFRGNGEQPFTSILWQNDTIQSHYSNTKGVGSGLTAPTVGTSYRENQVHVDFLFDLDDGSFSLWLDGEIKLQDKYPRTENLNKLEHMYAFLEAEHVCQAQFDNFHVYLPAKQTVWQDSFAGNEVDQAHWVTGAQQNISQEDGYLTLKRTDAAAAIDYLEGYIREDQKNVPEKVGVSFALRRSAQNKTVTLHLRGEGTSKNTFTSLIWNAGKVSSHFSNEKGVAGTSKTTLLGSDYNANQIYVDYLIDNSDGSFYLWIDGKQVIEKKYPRIANLKGIAYLRLYLEGTATMEAAFTDLHVYTEVDPEQAVAGDLELLTQESLLKVPMLENGLLVDSLDLPAKGKNGSTITWESSLPKVISKDGTVTRPAQDTPVTLQAALSYGSATEQTSFDFVVAGRRTDINGMPRNGSIIFQDRFDDGVLDAKAAADDSGGTIKEENGKAKITRTENSGSTMLTYYANADKSGMTGEIVTEFILERADVKPVRIHLRGNKGVYVSMDWDVDSVSARYRDKLSEKDKSRKLTGDFASGKQLKVTALFHTEDQSFSLWLNNREAVAEGYVRADTVKEFNCARIYLDGNSLTTLTVDDFTVSKMFPDMPDEQRVQQDMEALTYEKIIKPAEIIEGVIASDINLPDIGVNGSDIVWESSHPDIIDNMGAVTRPGEAYQTNPEVTLTATVSSGETSRQVVLKTKVLLAKVDISAQPGIKTIIYENGFSGNSLDSHITKAEDGGSVGIADGMLQVTRTDNTKDPTIADLYAREDQEAVRGAIGVEFKAKKIGSDIMQMRLRALGNTDYISLTWNKDNSVTILYRETQDGGQVNIKTKKYTGELHVKAFLDTEAEKFTLWLNGDEVLKNKYARIAGTDMLRYVRIYLEGTSFITACVDDFKIYHASLPPLDRISFDMRWLTDNKLLTGPYVTDNIIRDHLNLMMEAAYGSKITWTSSAPDIIAENGTVHRPMDVAENPEVVLTAKLEADGVEAVKTFRFRVLRGYTNGDDRVAAELAELDASRVTEENPEKITCSLALTENGLYVDEITWSSSDTTVITNSGRVIRPRSDQPSKNVVMTATLKDGSAIQKKDMAFTVLPDEEYTDPGYMSDEEFFGKYEGGKWTVESKLDYTRSDMRGVEEAVKQGDYAWAKKELLKHMRNRNVKLPEDLSKRDPAWVNMVLDDIYHLQGSKYYQGEVQVSSNEYDETTIDLKPSNIAKGGTNTYSVIARYNEASSLLIASKENPNPALRPKLVLTVNGQDKPYEVEADATIRSGLNRTSNYGSEPELEATMFGEFLGDNTSRALLRFQIDDLIDSDSVTGARLVLYTKVTPAYAGSKSIVVLYEPSNTWNEETVNWSALSGYVYNFNGVPGGNDWNAQVGCDAEYTFQMPRFLSWKEGASEYAYTKDEKYAYKMIRQMMDFIWDKGGPIKYPQKPAGQGWGSLKLRGGWPRTLDTAVRLRNWCSVMDTLADSRYMTPDVCTAIMKNIWDMNDNLTKSDSATGNWVQNEQMAVIVGAMSMPEFAKSEEWIAFGAKKNEELIFENNFPDGSYIEATAGYNMSAYNAFLDYKRLMAENGKPVPKEFDDMLLKAAYYNLLLRGPGGQALQYGDESAGTNTSQRYPELPQWYGDHEIEFIDSFGRKGIKPDWTSRLFPDSCVTMMRADWSMSAPFLFTNVRGGGQHGHADDNAIIAIAYGRTLLNDAGIFTYTSSDPYRQWGKSTRAHNTVEINDKSQKIGGAGNNYNHQGTIHDWVTNDAYDFLSQSTKSYADFDHRRSITFLKPNLWIVSDLVKPTDATKDNDYKQIWHMLPAADLKTDPEKKTIYSNFNSGANIIVASADQNVTVTEEDGYYDYGYQQLTDAKFAYFEQNDVKGDASYDTVLMPYKTKGADIDVQRIDLGVPSSQATAMKFDMTADGDKSKVYYLLDYAHDGSGRTMEQYTTNGKLTVVRTNDKGEVKELVLNEGSRVTAADGTVLIDVAEPLPDFDMELVGSTLNLNSSAPLEGVKLHVSGNIRAVMVNGVSMSFTRDGNELTVGNEEKPYIPPNDPNANKGGVSGGGGGGNEKPQESPTPTPSATPTTAPQPTPSYTPAPSEFEDVTEHWAADYIQDLEQQDILHGDGTGRFRPDDVVTRAEFIAMVARAAGLQEETPSGAFGDVSENGWYAGAVEAALKAELISPDSVFRPNDPVTREEISKVIAAALQLLQTPKEVPPEYQLTYEDAASISSWALDYVRQVTFLGLMNGRTDARFEPQGNATRAEMAAVLSRMLAMK